MWLPKKPMRRWHYAHAVKDYLRDPAILEQLKAVSREEAARLAKELGLFDDDATTSWTHPSRDWFMQTDGKVITPLYRSKTGQAVDKETGEVRQVRLDPDAKEHTVGGGNQRFGTKFAIVSARNDQIRVSSITSTCHRRERAARQGRRCAASSAWPRYFPVRTA